MKNVEGTPSAYRHCMSFAKHLLMRVWRCSCDVVGLPVFCGEGKDGVGRQDPDWGPRSTRGKASHCVLVPWAVTVQCLGKVSCEG